MGKRFRVRCSRWALAVASRDAREVHTRDARRDTAPESTGAAVERAHTRAGDTVASTVLLLLL